VIVVDRSGVGRRFLRSSIEADTSLVVAGEARTGAEAQLLMERLRPQVVVMQLDVPGGGIELIEQIMATMPTPILVCCPDARASSAAAALAAGAVDVVAQPQSQDLTGLAGYAEALRRGVRVASRVRVITHPRANLRGRGLLSSGPRLQVREGTDTAGIDLIVIGASTGGPQALAVVLAALPADFEPAILVVQHMADGFVEGLATWLDGICPLPVTVGAGGSHLRPGTVTIAPSGANLLVGDQLWTHSAPAPESQFNVPSIDATFTSVAESLGPRALGVLLTGMGRDGADGLNLMRERGAVTIGQDEATSVVWGMPGVAFAIGAVQQVLPLAEIAEAMVGAVRGPRRGRQVMGSVR
jgi:two-component system chemotaxis response regulator CheB